MLSLSLVVPQLLGGLLDLGAVALVWLCCGAHSQVSLGRALDHLS